jgi:F-type H+-transporting ATPase subunit epsilon
VTPERVLLSEEVRAIRVPGVAGSLGVLAGHAPLMTALSVGVIKVTHTNGDEEFIATSGGFLEVTRQKVIVLADTAERAEDIDISRVESAIAQAKADLQGGGAVDYDEASEALQRAMNRVKVAQMSNQ